MAVGEGGGGRLFLLLLFAAQLLRALAQRVKKIVKAGSKHC
jgi:hypothetical protein